jgi:hypothetical protein
MASITDVVPTGGTEGDTVTITGAGFGASQGGGGVTFDGQAASITSWSDISVVCTVPSGVSEKNVDLVVTGSDLSTDTEKFWRFELTGIDDVDWNSKGIFQYAPFAEVNSRTIAQSHDINRALERIEWLKRGSSSSVAVTNADSPYTPSSTLPYTRLLVDTSGGAVQINFPPVAGNSQIIEVTKITSDANLVTLQGDGAETIYLKGPGSQNTQKLYAQSDMIRVTPAGGEWVTIGESLLPHACHLRNTNGTAGYLSAQYAWVAMDTTIYDPLGMSTLAVHPLATEIDVLRDGSYLVIGRSNLYVGTTRYTHRTIIRVNNVQESEIEAYTGGNQTYSIISQRFDNLVAGDTFRFELFNDSGATRTMLGYTGNPPAHTFIMVIEQGRG